MDKQLNSLITEYAGKFFAQHPQIPKNQQKGIENEISNVVKNKMASKVNGGGLPELLDLFKQGTSGKDFSSNNLFSGISNDLVNSLSKKIGLPPNVGESLVNSVLPSVLGGLAKKTADKGDSSINMNDIISSLSGKKTAKKSGVDFNDLLGSVLGDGKSSGGGFDLDDIAGKLVGGKQSGGGLFGSIMKMFGK